MAVKSWSLLTPADDALKNTVPGLIRDVKEHAFTASGFYAEQQSTPDDTIAIYAGVVYFGITKVEYAGLAVVDLGTGGAFETTALTASYYNKVLFTIDSAGALAMTEGTENAALASVVAPAIPAGKFPICMVSVQDDGTATAGTILSIEQSEIQQLQGTNLLSTIASDPIWAAAGDLVQGTGVDTAAVLTAGTKGQVLQSGGAAAANSWVDKPNKNVIINGDFNIWQRGTSFSKAFTGFTDYAADRWKNYGSTTLLTVSRQTSGLDGSQYSMRVQRDAAETATTIIYTVNVMESRDSILLRGKHLTFSFWAKAGADFSAASNLLTATVQSGTGTDENSISVWTGGTDIATVGATLTTGWQKFTCTTSVVVPNTVTQLNVRLHYTAVGTAGANDWFEFTQAQLETGQSATAFEYRDYGTELAMCQRYYEKNYAIETAPGTASTTVGYNAFVCRGTDQLDRETVMFQVSKRAAPTVVIYSPNDGATGNMISSALTNYAAAVTSPSNSSFLAYPTTDLQASVIYLFMWTASAEL